MDCQNCGESVAIVSDTCSHCGVPISADGAGDDPDTDRVGGHRPESATQDTRGEISRRGLLAGGGIVLAAGGGGLYIFGSDSSSSPTDVVARSWETWEEGNAEAFADLYHSGSPERETDWWNNTVTAEDSDFGPDDGVDWTIERRETIEQTDERATVEEEYTWYDPLPEQPDQEIQQRLTYHIELRKENGAWKIWDHALVNRVE